MLRIGLAIALTISLPLVPLAAVAQATGRTPRIGWLATSAPGPFDEAFRQSQRERDYIEGQNIAIEWQSFKADFARGAKGIAVGLFALVLTLDTSVQEFAELVSLPDDARRERLQLPPACTPVVSAVKSADPNSSRLTVFVECSAGTTATSSPIDQRP